MVASPVSNTPSRTSTAIRMAETVASLSIPPLPLGAVPP
jgi:hypothetical protein